jgi:hypothetical protein
LNRIGRRGRTKKKKKKKKSVERSSPAERPATNQNVPSVALRRPRERIKEEEKEEEKNRKKRKESILNSFLEVLPFLRLAVCVCVCLITERFSQV